MHHETVAVSNDEVLICLRQFESRNAVALCSAMMQLDGPGIWWWASSGRG